jgi:hypothetical protein
MPESGYHSSLKVLLERKLEEWFGAGVSEYPSSGHELDVFAVTPDGITIYAEVIWSESRTHFLHDMNMLQQSDANVKVVIGSPEVIQTDQLSREFSKVVVAERKRGTLISGQILDGERILSDSDYVENDLRTMFEGLVKQAESKLRTRHDSELGIEDVNILKSEWAQGDYYNIIGRVVCKGKRIVRNLKVDLNVVSADSPVELVSVSNNGSVSNLDWKYLDHTWSPDGTDNNNRTGEWPELRQGDFIYIVLPNFVGTGFGPISGPLHWQKHFLRLKPSTKYKFKLVINGVSGDETVLAERTFDVTT